MADWLVSDEFLNGHENLASFDLFTLLAEDDPNASDYNMLREDYREGDDSHPTKTANQFIGPIFVESVVGAIEAYRE